MKLGLLPAEDGEEIWAEARMQKGRGVYLTKDLNRARAFACETTKTKNDSFFESVDLLTIMPDRSDVCIYEIRLPKNIQVESDDILHDWRTKNQKIPTHFLKILHPKNIAKRLQINVTDLCKAEEAEVQWILENE